MRKLALILLVAIALVPLNATESKKKTPKLEFAIEPKDVLRGMGGMMVSAEVRSSTLRQAGIYDQRIQTDMELKLRMAGVKIEDCAKIKGCPHLAVLIKGKKHNNGKSIAVSINLYLLEDVFLARDPNRMVRAATWNDNGGGIAGDLVVNDATRKWTQNLVDNFLNDYLAANQ